METKRASWIGGTRSRSGGPSGGEEKKRREADTSDVGLGSAAIFAALNRHVPENAIIAVDVGNNTYSFGRYFECQNQAVLMSGYLGSIGFALPAAIGAWAATKEAHVVVSLLTEPTVLKEGLARLLRNVADRVGSPG